MNESPTDRTPEEPRLTVEEAARVLRIGRSLAYQLAAEYDASGGSAGMPVIRIGGCLRVPRWALLELGRPITTDQIIATIDQLDQHAQRTNSPGVQLLSDVMNRWAQHNGLEIVACRQVPITGGIDLDIEI